MSVTPATVEDRPMFNELERFSLYTNTPGVEGKRAKLAFVEYNRNARISVFTNHPDDQGKGPINAPMGPDMFIMFLDELAKIVEGPNDVKGFMECKRGELLDGKQTGNKILISTLYFGKDAEGMVWLLVKAEGRPEIQFHFGISDYHTFKLSNGAVTPAYLSQANARAVIFALKDTFTRLCSGFRKALPVTSTTTKAPMASKQTAEFEDIGF